MKVSNKGIELMKSFEGCRLTAYLCPAGVWTIGYGHTAGVKKGQTISQNQADAYLASDLKKYEEYIDEDCPIRVLSNETGINGAAALLYPKMPEYIYKTVGGNYYLLPSSVHEFLIVPEKKGINPSELVAIVREVNRTEIEKEEFLSDDIYYFNHDIITKM